MANWLHHKICTEDQVMKVMKKMAKIVDEQNSQDTNYVPMSTNFENSIAFITACDLIFKGSSQPSGYTEPLLHKRRLEKKSSH
jgi:malate synthase